MTSILTAPRLAVKFDSAKVARPARPFGLGILPPALPTLAIAGVLYDVQTARGDDGERVVRLSSHADPAGVYDVSRGADGLVACDCPDYTFRKLHTAETCKHGRACVAAGLVDAPAPVANPTGPDRTRPAAPVNRIAGYLDAPKAKPARRGPSAEDMAWVAGRTAALESGHANVVPPVRLASAERAAWITGLAAGLAELEARLEQDELQARWEHGELAEARMALPGEVRD